MLTVENMDDPTRWQAADVLRIAGWGCVFLAIVLVFPAVGVGSGASHEPGSDTIRALSHERSYGLAAGASAVLGLVLLAVAKLADRA